MAEYGQKTCVFSGGFHKEMLIVTNPNEVAAHLSFDIYFSDREPVKGLTYTIASERVTCFDLCKPFADQKYRIPSGVYTIVLHSDIPVAADIKTV